MDRADVRPTAAREKAAREKTAGEIAALLRLADLDSTLLDREEDGEEGVDDEMANERRRLRARLSPEVLEAYDRSLRAGRRPAVARLVGSVCSGCNMRMHSKLEQQIRRRRGVAPCPRCLRLVYDPAWLAAATLHVVQQAGACREEGRGDR